MAELLGNTSGAEYWAASAAALLPRLREMFYVPSTEPASSGFFQDRFFSGATVDVRVLFSHTLFAQFGGCHPYARCFHEKRFFIARWG
jgi:hypothetical protein